MIGQRGKFVWYEYMGDDLDAASKFYADVVGWGVADAGMAGFPYRIASVGAHGVAGLMTIPDDAKAMGAPPCWTGYLWVEDVDGALPELTAAGARLMKGPQDIPGVGRFALIADPGGAMFMIFRDAGGNPPPPPPAGTPGLVGWRELHAGDGDVALAFYSGHFGWKHDRDFDMGPMGVYHIFETAPGEQGGIMTKMPNAPGAYWRYYFSVDGIDAAIARVGAGGGKVPIGPIQVPTGDWVVQAIDPQGALFALVSPTR
jgi:predicted enzyme related to lactoylglutathione lyase